MPHRLGLAVVVLGFAAGCAAAPSAPVVPAPTITPAATAAAPAGAAAPASVPTLGLAWPGGGSRGYGEVRPTVIDNGGDPTGLVTDITWDSWGGPTATGHGTTTRVPRQGPVAQGQQERATVVAYQLGACGGHPAYRAVQHFFPRHGESFDQAADTYNACTGP